MENKKLKKDIKKYIKNIKRNLPCVNKTMQDLIKKMQKSIEVYVYENNVENIKEIERIYNSQGIKTIYEENQGNHFKDGTLRMAKGIKWILE